MALQHVCGFYYIENSYSRNPQHRNYGWVGPPRRYLPQVSLSAHTIIFSSVSRTTLTQTFINPSTDTAIPELRYTFPLYDGVSVVGFVCTIDKDRVITGVVKEKYRARQVYQAAVDRGETAGLLEQLPDAADVFTTSVGNVPAGAEIKVVITYLGELQHDAGVDGIRFTLPTRIAPRYGDYPGELVRRPSSVTAESGIEIVVDAEMPVGSNIKAVQSPSHPIAVSIGCTSTATGSDEMSLRKASATLSLGSAELDKDFVVQIVAANTSNPVALLETHPNFPSQRALMTTLVPKFSLPASRPEIVFVCDRSGSMQSGRKIPNLKSALQIFLKSLPVGVKFNICSFGSRHSFLFPKGSRSYDQDSLDQANRHVETFSANYGGTEMYAPLEATFQKRYKDMELEVFVLTDGDIWDQERLFSMVNSYVGGESGASVRVFTLGIGADVSHGLVEGLARSGNGFAQIVAENEKMSSKVVRMLKAALSPHVTDYTLEVKYGNAEAGPLEDDFEIVEKVMDSLSLGVAESGEVTNNVPRSPETKPISLFDPSADSDLDMTDASIGDADNKFSHVPVVEVPKLLQAPFQIPPLFPFSRSTVYLLLSPDTIQRTPMSVVLRGTSKHGPLSLEIPITALDTENTTIHQLAARKAVQELEEGRGWIRHAKDRDGKSLEETYEGRFPDMVEREAIRLGTQYQVVGKWCSFVAVEAGAGADGDADRDGDAETQHERLRTTSLEASSKPPGFGTLHGVACRNATQQSSSYSAAPVPGLVTTRPADPKRQRLSEKPRLRDRRSHSNVVDSTLQRPTTYFAGNGMLDGMPPPPPRAQDQAVPQMRQAQSTQPMQQPLQMQQLALHQAQQAQLQMQQMQQAQQEMQQAQQQMQRMQQTQQMQQGPALMTQLRGAPPSGGRRGGQKRSKVSGSSPVSQIIACYQIVFELRGSVAALGPLHYLPPTLPT